MKWFKRYAIGCMIAMFVFAAVDANDRPGGELRPGIIILVGLSWPIGVPIILGSTVGELLSDKATANQAEADCSK